MLVQWSYKNQLAKSEMEKKYNKASITTYPFVTDVQVLIALHMVFVIRN